jgi:hypothetical protein
MQGFSIFENANNLKNGRFFGCLDAVDNVLKGFLLSVA